MPAVLLLAVAGCGDSLETTESEPEQSYRDSALVVESMSAKEMTFTLSAADIELREVEIQGERFSQIRGSDTALFGEPGEPGIPHRCIFFAIPQGAQVTFEVKQGESTFVDNVLLMPVQHPMPDTYDVPKPPFAYQKEAYEIDALLPETLLYLEPEKILRGLRVNHLWVSPFRYNARQKRLEVIENLTVTIRFEGGTDRFFSDPVYRSAAHDGLFSRLLVNRSMISQHHATRPNPKGEQGATFLIITDPLFIEAANTLARWKTRTGIPTEVVTTEATGRSAEKITDYISQAYRRKQSPVQYVLFIGDAEFIPTHYQTFHTSHFSMGGSDMYYGCVDGKDLFADVGIGRLSVDTPQQANRRVDRIIGYEKAIVQDESYYTTSYHFAYFQDEDLNGRADRRFSLTSEEIVQWFDQVLEGSEVTPNRCFTTSSKVSPRKWSNISSYHFFADWWPFDTENLPDFLLRKNGFSWQCTVQDIAQAVNSGGFFMTHRDHGASTGWGDPSFWVENVEQLNNGDKLPVLWSINCQNGWFDNETDSKVNFSDSEEVCFSEAWERNPNGGAVGLISSSRISYSGYNDRLVWGWMDAVWPGYIPRYPSEKQSDFVPAASEVLDYGKLYLTTVYSPGQTRKVAVEEFHWFGDPTMTMWTRPPMTLEVEHTMAVAYTAEQFTVQIEQNGAVATLMAGDLLLGSTVSEQGKAVFALPPQSSKPGAMVLTISKPGYRPYEATIKTAQCGENSDCQDDVFCNGQELCVQNTCVAAIEPADCDDGLFCNGQEICDTQSDACAPGDAPCPDMTQCDEEVGKCTLGENESKSQDYCGF